ncbi:hypothetical protein OH76DRAFT_1057759 [Lentinus brumalis]|uniref:Nitrogen regulatory protein areA GATA-like domain-containing protein n=1 Tax=Lentinus brumalis TaxID=2498619 RepID=A0A371DN98_9APHY|nr:hypothetical protein OH76DRAFT_1057759 [Polyporus brumalis]
MSMPVPATLTSYLPVLLVSVTHNAVPDDSSFYTQPEGQVDYLSHNWREEDVWRSWRSMTRQKNAIANGMRLENASWRTWWKQRNGLKTISPETLNWLKDSDVTWLYGPLHIGHDWTDYSQHKVPKLHRKTSHDELPSYKSNSSPSPAPKKPILKRRSISQLLSLPASPFFHHDDSDDEEEDCHGDGTHSPARPPLVHTKSDTHISMRGRPFRKDSPPRIIAEDSAVSHHEPTRPGLPTTASSEASGSTGSDQDLSGSSSHGPDGPAKKKHISFNTFVEQCIAIEKPKLKRSPTGPTRGGRMFDAYDDGYDSETGYDGEYDEPASVYYYNDHAVGSDSEDDDDDDVLEMRTASSRSRSNSASSMRKPSLPTPLSPEATGSRPRPPMVRRSSTDRERVTIAPIAPTLLKSTGVGNELGTLPEGRTYESPQDVDLVYVPTASYSSPGTPSMGSNEDVYHHRESYFSVGTGTSYPRSPLPRSPAPGSSPRIPSVGMPSEPGASSMRRTSSGTFFPTQHIIDSPMQIDDLPIEDAYDYFGGPDLGEDFSDDRPHLARRHRRRDVRDDDRGGEITRYAEGGAGSVTTGRSSSWRASPSPSDSPKTPDTDMPVVVVNEVNGAVEERQERSRESSPSRSSAYGSSSIPSTPAVPVPRVNPTHAHGHVAASPLPNSLSSSAPSTGVCADSELLSPSDGMPTRGRTPHSPSVSGSTTTGSSSYRSSDSRSGSRGRSSTRTSSFSDREGSRSHSRGRGANSPIGSISPTGSTIGIVNGGAYASGRCRERGDRDVRGGRGSRRSEEERGRERTGRRLGDSLSPPSIVSSPSRRSGSDDDGGLYQPYSPVLTESILEKPGRIPSPPSSVSGSSTETASVSTVGPSVAQQQAQQGQQEHAERSRSAVHAPAAKTPVPPFPIPSPIPEEIEEEEEQRSRHPTPANSPVAAFRMPVPPAQKAEPISSPISASHEPPASASRTSSNGSVEASTADSGVASPSPESPTRTPGSRHPTRAQRVSFDGMQEQAGTLVNRAAEIVQSARGFLGSIWNPNPPAASLP